ncbi:hypothetical protein BD626DRAFT_564541 [Schizophyllum amplum]|uniref:Uncharacterized protein n=1 Tax=Schizophyllum amplum TaxID=97359 RepID=A0A550CS76_9AGAR|nr:hypothetical protein BD626DRAFT_564541 [Auriculariopsis ampla]
MGSMSFDGFSNIYAQPQAQPSLHPSQYPAQQQQQPSQADWQAQSFNGAFYGSQRPAQSGMQEQQQYYMNEQGQVAAYGNGGQPRNVEQRMNPQTHQAQLSAQYYRRSYTGGAQQQQFYNGASPRPPPPRNELELALGMPAAASESPSFAPHNSSQLPPTTQKVYPPVPTPADNALSMQIKQILEQLSTMKRDGESERERTTARENHLQDELSAVKSDLANRVERFEHIERSLREQIAGLWNQLNSLSHSPPQAWAQLRFAAPHPSMQTGMPPPSPVSLPSVESPYADSPAMRHQLLAPPQNAGYMPPSSLPQQQMMRLRHESSPMFAVAHPPPLPPSQHASASALLPHQVVLPPSSPHQQAGQAPMPTISRFQVKAEPQVSGPLPPSQAPSGQPAPSQTPTSLGKRKSEDDMESTHQKSPRFNIVNITTLPDALFAHTLHCMRISEDEMLPDEPAEPGLPWPPSEPVRFAWSVTLRRSKHNQAMARRIAADLSQNRGRYPAVPAQELEEDALVAAMAPVYEALRERYKQQGRSRKRPTSQAKSAKARQGGR